MIKLDLKSHDIKFKILDSTSVCGTVTGIGAPKKPGLIYYFYYLGKFRENRESSRKFSFFERKKASHHSGTPPHEVNL